MTKKTIKAEHALKHKGMKAPRPKQGMELDASSAPKHRPSMQHKEPTGQFKEPKNGEQSQKLDHKKKALPSKDAPEGVKGPNGGESMGMKPTGNGDKY